MALTGEQLLTHIKSTRLVPVYSHDDPDTAHTVVKTSYKAGIRVFEFTNRSPLALQVFQNLISRRSSFPGMWLGVGTIMDAAQCRAFIDAGADFIVSPIVDPEVAHMCQEANISWTPGCGTLTELIQGERLGAKLMKVFPADVLGPKFIKGVLGPCPQLHLMPTGGVTPDEANLASWFNAGVACVGMGSQMMDKKLIEEGNFDELGMNIAQTLITIKNLQRP